MVNRFQDLLNARPKGRFYQAAGEILPFHDTPYEFQFRTLKANRLFLIFFNEVSSGQVVTDSQGLAIVRTVPGLAPGRYDIRITDPLDDTSFVDTITVQNVATWLAAYADVLEEFDDEIDDMEAALSIDTVTSKYAQNSYGRLVRQPQPQNFLHEEYRNALIQLRPAYRHFGAHLYGLEQAVASLTSVTPFRVPQAWRPHWILGSQLMENGELQMRAHTSEVLYAPPGAVGPFPHIELEDINRQSRYFVHPAVSNVLITSGFRQPPFAQTLTVTVPDASRLTLTGLDENEATFSEIIPDPSITAAAGTYRSQKLFTSITSAIKTTISTGQIGLGESRFAHITRVGDYTNGTVSLSYLGYDVDDRPQFRWGSGQTISTDQQSIVTLPSVGSRAQAVGVSETSTIFDLNPGGGGDEEEYYDWLWIEINGRGVLGIDLSGGVPTTIITPASVVTAINSALTTDPRYGAGFGTSAFTITGTEGDADTVVAIRSPQVFDPSLGQQAQVLIAPGPSDAAPSVFHLPRTTTYLNTAISGTTLNVVDSEGMPSLALTDDESKRFKIRVRGLRDSMSSGTLTPGTNSFRAVLSLSSYTFSSVDIGGYIRWTDGMNPANNTGLHKIIDITAGDAILLHQNASSGGAFLIVISTVGQGAVMGTGEIVTIIENNKTTNQLTAETAPYTWPGKAIVELVDETPSFVQGHLGLGRVDVDVDALYRPLHDFGDTISNVVGTTWRITSTRGFFVGLAGETITVSSAENAENNGDFVLTATTTTTATFTNPLGVAETSNFEWSIDSFTSPIVDSVTSSGSQMPDGWQVMSAATSVVFSNVSQFGDSGQPGYLVPSRLLLKSTNNIRIQKDIPNALAYRGLLLNVTFWLQEHTTDLVEYLIDVSFDEGLSFFFVSDISSVVSSALNLSLRLGPLSPFSLSGSFFVPFNATSVIVRLTRTPDIAASGTFSLEKVILSSPTHTALFLGHNTIPRSAKREKFGEVLYIWSAESLTEEERLFIGVPDPTVLGVNGQQTTIVMKSGHVDYITNAHGYWERVDISELDDSGPTLIRTNIRGAYDSIDWLAVDAALGLTNMEVIVGTPSKETYVAPTVVTHIDLESLELIDGGDGPGTARANLNAFSNHQGTYPQDPNTLGGSGARLYEARINITTQVNPDGSVTIIPIGALIPIHDTPGVDAIQPWEFTASDQIRINSPYFNPTSEYFLAYDILMQAVTEPIELAVSGSDPTEYLWLVDFTQYSRHQAEELVRERRESAVFNASFQAILSERADVLEAATLERDNGSMIETVSTVDWFFVDSKTIQISGAVFDANSLYVVTYAALVPSIQTDVSYILEWRSADTSAGLTTEAWMSVKNNQVISPEFEPGDDVSLNLVKPWHQMRVTITGVVDVRDVRVYGLGLKGIHLYGTDPNAPGVVIEES